MFYSFAKRSVLGLALCGFLLSLFTVTEAAAINTKAFAGNYSVGVQPLGGIFYRGGADGFTAVVKVNNSGKLSGTWTTSTDGLRDTGTVKLTGTISKIAKGKLSQKAKFTFKLSDGAQGTGTIEAFVGGSAAITGSLRKSGAQSSFAGARVFNF